MLALVAVPHPRNAFVDLLENVLPRQSSARAEAAVVAKGAPSQRNRAIDIGARETGIDTYSLDPKSKNLAKVKTVPKVAQARVPPVELAAIMWPT